MADSLTGVAFRFAGFWLRLIAAAIDAGILLLVMWFISVLFGVNIATLEPTQTDILGFQLFMGASVLLGWLYYALMESIGPQATLGKLFMGIYVTNLEGDRISFTNASFRHWMKYVSTVIFFLGFLIAGVTRRKQALHDMVSHCLVLKR